MPWAAKAADPPTAGSAVGHRARDELIGMKITDLLGVLPAPPGRDPPTHGIRLELFSRGKDGRIWTTSSVA